jgi:ketosteroid isomerase-like protein
MRHPEVVRTPLSVRPHSRRSLEQRLTIRYPRASALLFRFLLLLPPRSRLRRATLARGIQQGLEAYNRGDYETVLAGYDPNIELISEPEVVELGFDATYHGHDGWRRYAERWNAEWGAYATRPEELIDLGDGRALVVGTQRARGSGSGAEAVKDFAVLWTFASGRVAREQYFFDRADAFRIAGLDP